MAMKPIEQFYDVQTNILDRVGDNSIDDEEVKGIAALFGLDVLKRLVNRKDNILDNNIEEINKQEIIRNGRNEVLWNKRNEVLENNKLIKQQGPIAFFDAEAEAVFNNPATHEHSEVKKDNPDFVFNSQEFEDRNSPMYKVKTDWKNNYIQKVLLPAHQKKYNEIDQNILTFDEYNTNNRELTKHEIEYAKRPSERSLLRQWNLFGRKRTQKLKESYDQAKQAEENIRLEREGYLLPKSRLFQINPQTGDTYGSTLSGTVRPFEGLTKEQYAKGEEYNEFEFINTNEYKGLSLQGRQLAIQRFKDNESFEIKNNTYELLNIFTSVSLLEEEEIKKAKFNNIKYNDPEFLNKKPTRIKGQTRSAYESSQAYQDWKTSVDTAYAVDSVKFIKAREKSGYDISRSDELNLAIEENLDYIADLRESKRQLEDKTITQKEYDDAVQNFKDKTIENIIEKELDTTDKKQAFINGIQEDRTSVMLDNLKTLKGQDAMDKWFDNHNRLRIENGMQPEPPTNKKSLYTVTMMGVILEDSAALVDILILDEAGNIGLNPDLIPDEFLIDEDSI